ncbi:MAG: hypothetical protein ISS79_08930 [Phycisphaerae bacterium]|nr:hypothetical protein [Phycisphaerae bacterium]
MTNSKKWQIAIALVLTCNFALWSAEEPNDPNHPQIKIELSDQEKSWSKSRPLRQLRQDSISPTHVAEGFVQSQYGRSLKPDIFLKTSAGAAMSPKQREFIESTDAFIYMGPSTTTGPQRSFYLYAVSEADARRMIEALMEILGERPKQIRLEYARRLRQYREEMAKAKGLLPGKEALLPSVKADYDKSKELAHPFSADTEAAGRAKETILEMSKMLDTLDVELAGIRGKLKVIQEYWSQDGTWTKEAFAKLQEMQIIQTIELKGAEARREAAVAIRKREKDFLDLFDQWLSLESEVKHLKSTIKNREERIAQIEAILANPKPDMLPPKIYQDKVVIYPVRVD